ncbi:uncharacterized protein BO95DRAFT_86769 [Aspergillus brunneoviolaceus CBS 621.78]|uniref:Uncharacterized protein n=1 Tax=Aspergillus brunneoviolaceus CBS 621.78 TaxID=1450534 RepID=A0ACD1GD88_9EURO|nr:hypothetical protein BO95DRAFT_86769 [Aspergillus brunneoviolaceus CBS 621.78]RAH47228.1 hypothetical protein BO95DRAFT_86769 [Aspergillus brunneoviolaceus CBS 621.78]
MDGEFPEADYWEPDSSDALGKYCTCRSNVRQWCVEATSKDEIGVHDGRGVVYGVLHIVLALNMLASFRGYWPRILPARRRRHLLYLKTRL